MSQSSLPREHSDQQLTLLCVCRGTGGYAPPVLTGVLPLCCSTSDRIGKTRLTSAAACLVPTARSGSCQLEQRQQRWGGDEPRYVDPLLSLRKTNGGHTRLSVAAEAARMEYLSRAQSVVRESAGGGGAGGGGGWAAQRDGGAYSGLLAGERYLTHPALVSSSVPLPSGVGMGMTTRDGPSTISLPRRLCGVADSTGFLQVS